MFLVHKERRLVRFLDLAVFLSVKYDTILVFQLPSEPVIF